VERFSFHDIRRAMADRLRRLNVPVDVYCRYMGHAPITGLRHYSIVTRDDLHEAHRKALTNARRRSKKDTGC
jgi:integrase